MATDNHPDKGFIEYLLKKILDNPEDIKVVRTIDDLGVLITVEVNQNDMGTLIGKNGQTAKSIRTILRIIGSKQNERVNLKIIDPNKENLFGGKDLYEELDTVYS